MKIEKKIKKNVKRLRKICVKIKIDLKQIQEDESIIRTVNKNRIKLGNEYERKIRIEKDGGK